jgi:histidyl-tRNA synthetase
LFGQLLELGLIGHARAAVAHVLVLAVEAAMALDYARLAAEMREAGLNVEVYGGDDKLGKQLKYADRSKIPLAVIYGPREKDAGIVKLKDLREAAVTKEHDVPRGDLVLRIKQLVG